MTVEGIRTICFVGAGTMGCANSLVAAVSGYDVVINDARPESLDGVAVRHAEIGAFLVSAGYCSQGALADALVRISLEPDLSRSVANADMVSESVFESIDVKRQVFGRLDEVAPSHTILTTNTSTLLVSDLEDVVERGDRFAALHSHLGSLLFDIVGGPRTSPETIDTLRRYVSSLGGVPLVLKNEHRGYVFNAMNGSLLSTSLRLVAREQATVEEVDRAWMVDRKAPMGPFGMMDLFGLDLVLDTWRRPRDDTDDRALAAEVLPLLTAMVDGGRLGLKSGGGFYDYPDPAFQDPSFRNAAPVVALVANVLVAAVVSTAASLVVADVASAADVDMAWTAATGLDPGPFEIVRRDGVDAFVERLDELIAAGFSSPEAARVAVERLRQVG